MSKTLPDIQDESSPEHFAPIQKVGVSRVKMPLPGITPNATISLQVSLGQHTRGTHMSRLIEALYAGRESGFDITPEKIIAAVEQKLPPSDIYLRIEYDDFVMRKAPVSEKGGWHPYKARIIAWKMAGESVQKIIGVDAAMTTLCPCSKEISERGAHNQRSIVSVDAWESGYGGSKLTHDLLLGIAEQGASSLLYPILKRPDEKSVTETAYDNPRFVEDVVREVLWAARERAAGLFHWLRITSTNQESIHAHDATATIVHSIKTPPEGCSP